VQIFNLRLDALITSVFMALVVLILAEAMRSWYRALRGDQLAGATEPSRPA
jgi:hypothetical protein